MGKGEIARYEQFLLFPQCFQKACFPGASKGVIVWEWVNTVTGDLGLTFIRKTISNFSWPAGKSRMLLEDTHLQRPVLHVRLETGVSSMRVLNFNTVPHRTSNKSLPNDKFVDWSKLKAIADDKFDVVEIMTSLFDTLKNTAGKG